MPMLKFIDAWEENIYTLNKKEYEWLAFNCMSLGIKSVLEFGPGSSTFAFLENGCEIWSLENNPEWVTKHRETFSRFSNVHIGGYDVAADLVLDEIPVRRFDCAFVDAPNGGDYFKHHSRLSSLEFARTRTDRIFLHDANRPKEKRSVEYMHDKGWTLRESCPVSERGFVLLERIKEWNPIQEDAESLIDLSLAHYRAKRYGESIIAASKALELDPRSVGAYNNICAANNHLGNFAEGKKAAEQALRIDPNNQLAKNNLEWSIRELNKK